jgi:hypothetical protein
MVKNEQDIIEPMIRHNAGLLDALIVLDNGSVDDTRVIALALARELGNVVITDSTKFGYTQGERMTRLLHATQTGYFADFIVFLDADEFIGATTRAAFHAELEKIPHLFFGGMRWCNYVLRDGVTAIDPPNGMTDRIATEGLPIFKAVLRLDGALGTDLVVARGNHAFHRTGQLLPAVLLPDLPIWHFPVRGHAQLTAKALVGWLACLAANPRAAETPQSYHWKVMYESVISGAGIDATALRQLSLHYAEPDYVLGGFGPPDPPVMFDPAPIRTERRYSTGVFLDPLILLARSWEQSLRANDPLFAPEEAPDAEIDIPPFRFLYEKHQFGSVLDGACGAGLTLEMFARLGVADLAGVGPLPHEAVMLRRGGYVSHDTAIAYSLGRQYDLVLCLHTVATVPAQAAMTFIANANRHTQSMVAFSLDDTTAEHLELWLARWHVCGWVPDLMETLALRSLSSTASLRRGLVILRRSGPAGTERPEADPLNGTAELVSIARRPFRAPSPTPCIHEEPLLDPAEASWSGYTES